MSDADQFHALLLGLGSADNNLRNEAEKKYEEIPLVNRFTSLVSVLSVKQSSPELHQLSAVLLRRIITTNFDDSFKCLDPKLQEEVKQQFILSTQQEENEVVRRKKADCIAELARRLFDDKGNNQWPEVLKFMFHCVSSENLGLKEVPLHVFCQFPGIFGSQQLHYQEVIHQMLGQCMQVQEASQLRYVAAKATVAFLLNNVADTSLLRHFTDLVPGVLQDAPGKIGGQVLLATPTGKRPRGRPRTRWSDYISDLAWSRLGVEPAELSEIAVDRGVFRFLLGLLPPEAVDGSAQDDQDSVLKSLVELCEDAPKVVRPHVESVLTVCLKIVADCDREDNIRQLALEAIVTLAETAPGLIRKQKTMITHIIPQMLAMMVDLDDDESALAEWSVADEAEEDDCDANTVAGENAIDRFACAVGGKTMLPHIMSTVPPMLQNTDWRYRHAGLMAISAVGEGCHKFMEEILQQVVDAVLPFLVDPHPRVRYAACNAIGQMCTDFANTMQKQFHTKIVPALCGVLDDQGNPRVQAHAGAALVNFVEDCPKTVLVPYLDPLCSKLEHVLSTKIQELVQKGTKLVLEQVTTTIAAVADTAEEKFTAFYDRFMPSLKYIMENAHSDELRMLRGKTIECISLIGLAVGPQKFMPDAQAIMEQLLKTQANIESWEDDDPQISYMISAWARMCKLLGQEFVQYLPVVMGPLMKAASIKPEVAMLDSQDIDSIEEDDGWEFIKLGDQQSFGIKTAGLEEKSTACQMLVCYARELKEGFVEYVEEVVKLMVPLLKFYFHDGVRSSAAESVPLLMECAQLRGSDYVGQIWSFIAPNILGAVKDEPDKDVLSVVMESLARCIELRGKGCFTSEQYQELAATLQAMLDQHFQRANERLEKRNDEDYDEQVEEALQDEDQDDFYILSKIADILHSLFGSHGPDLFPLFDCLLPHYAKLLEPQRPWPDRQWALCVFDDVIEYTGSQSVKYRDVFLGPMLRYLEDESGEVRQAASYGIGVMATSAGEEYPDVIKEALPRLCRVIEGPRGRGSTNQQLVHDDIAPMENCISAVGKILKYQPRLVGSQAEVDQLLRRWLSWLPVTEDKEEAVHVYGYICDLIESNNPTILGENHCNLPAVISLLGEAVYGEATSDSKEVTGRVISICKHIQASFAPIWNDSLSQLPNPIQLALNNLLLGPAA